MVTADLQSTQWWRKVERCRNQQVHSSSARWPTQRQREEVSGCGGAADGGPKLKTAMENEARAPSSSDFGTLLRQHRLAAGLSQEALADRARMSANGIGALERGYRRNPQRETLALLADALGLSGEDRRAFERAASRPAGPRRPIGRSAAAEFWSDTYTARLPLSLTTFVGREAELREIASLVHEHRLVTLTGTGGVGKTQTALRVGASFGNGEAKPVAFVGLAPVESRSSVIAAVASAIGVREAPNRPLLDVVLAHVRNKALLLILDNCEHVIADAAVLADAVLSRCPRIRILATSREPLRVGGERVYRLPSLSVPEALALFADRARAVEHRFSVTDDDVPPLTDLCRRLDGIPLAIELAAARVNLLSIRALGERLDERFRILTGGERTALRRQQTMRATIDWSYELLDAPERRLFERLAVFVGGCTLEAAESVVCDATLRASDVFETLSSLAEKSLVVAELEGASPRYRFLESTRAFAIEKLRESGEHSTFAHRYALWVAVLADRARTSGATMPIEPWVREFEPELENARAAFDSTLSGGDVVLAARIACGFTGVWRMNHGNSEPRRWLETVLPRLDDAVTPVIMASIWRALSTVTFGMRKIEAAERALEFDSRCDDPIENAASLYQLSQGLLEVGRIDEADAANERALRLCRNNGLTRSRRYAALLDMRARVAVRHDRVDDARQCYAQALAVMSAMGDEHEAILIRINMAELEFKAGDVPQALEFAEMAAAGARHVRSRHREATALTNLAAYKIAVGDTEGARRDAAQALTLALGAQPIGAAIAIQHLATVAALGTDARSGARLRGYVDAWYREEGCERELTERRSYDTLMSALRARLGDPEIEALAQQGARFSEEEAAVEALTV
jgi:predicted ATPase/ribosome-binding protein aMBF1 (putative translation factor)